MVAVSMATKSTLTVCLCFLSNLNGPYWSCCPSQTALIEYCFHGDPNQGYDASCLHTLGGSGWWGREWHDKCPASVGKHFAAAQECVPLSKVVGYRTTKRTMQCRQSALTPSPTPHYGPCALLRFPSAMHQVDASSKKLWPFFFLAYLFCIAIARLLYVTVLVLRCTAFDDKRQDMNYMSLATFISHTQRNLPTKKKLKACKHAHKKHWMHTYKARFHSRRPDFYTYKVIL